MKCNICGVSIGFNLQYFKKLPELDFDCSCPADTKVTPEYKSLHDPHLKSYYYTHGVRERLIRMGFITHDGKVLCNLKEFNDYRKHLKRVNLLLQKRREVCIMFEHIVWSNALYPHIGARRNCYRKRQKRQYLKIYYCHKKAKRSFWGFGMLMCVLIWLNEPFSVFCANFQQNFKIPRQTGLSCL